MRVTEEYAAWQSAGAPEARWLWRWTWEDDGFDHDGPAGFAATQAEALVAARTEDPRPGLWRRLVARIRRRQLVPAPEAWQLVVGRQRAVIVDHEGIPVGDLAELRRAQRAAGPGARSALPQHLSIEWHTEET